VYTDSLRTEISISPRRKTRPLLVAAVMITATLFALPHWFIVNRTASSAPRGIYFRTHAPLHRGQLVEACLPHEVALFAASRAYIRGTGRCGDNTEPVIKEIGAMPEEEVYVSPTTILTTDSGGRPMTESFPGWHRIPTREIWLHGSARNSFDSRYFGAVPIENVNAVLKLIVTW
jgi:conjugative transfer signal peptidase TraF